MDSQAFVESDRKRKAEESTELEQEEAPLKRPLLETTVNDETNSSPDSELKPEEEQTKTEHDVDAKPEVKPEVKSENKTETPLTTVVPFDRLIILHLEATCDENPTNPAAVQVTKENSEIIEISFVVVDASNMDVLHKQQIYVKPERTPLTPFCSEITGIKSSVLETAGSLKDAIDQFDNYIQRELEQQQKSFCFVTHGGWALRIQLPRECRDKNITLPNYLAYCRMFDLKQEIQRWQVHHPEVSLRSTSVRDLCEIFKLNRVTDQTVGLNNALTTVNILRYFLSFHHSDVFVHPIDTEADLKQFKREESQVIHLAGLPFEVTQGELEAWFSSNGLRPTTMWMIQPTDNAKPSISGFVVFQHHQDAMRALSLNGRCLGDRPIEVCPSSSRVIDAAGSMLIPFPLQAKSRQLRPGDWNCSNCAFYNFASRLYCFKCNTVNPNPGPQAGMGPPAQTFVVGDWMCPGCNFHNYSSRMQCKKCGGPKPPTNKVFKGNKKLVNVPMAPQSHYGSYYGSGGRPPHYHHHHQPITFRPGDWYCPNTACGFQNFASRSTCFKCHTPNPNQQQQQQHHQQYHPQQQHQQYHPQQSQYHPQQHQHQHQHQHQQQQQSPYGGGYAQNVRYS
ncbi:MAG: ribonuclease H-like domain-containing protein [Benjaminiella poitrasii]|nr:MAG: ribonuclease H-like domain-containing protein [Benjaminiella poitrasii]